MCLNTKRTKIACFILVFAFIAINCSDNGTGPEPTRGVATIDLNNTKQIIRGFGGVNMPGWIDDMTPEQVNKAFGADSGQIGMTILRIRVPCDSSAFGLEVPTAQLAKSLGAIIIASPWSPPAYMKSNNNIVGGTLNNSFYTAYAAYLKAFADSQDNGTQILGYFHWTFMDNFEWARGYRERMGLVHIDYTTHKRTPKESAYWYRDVIESNGGILF